MNIHTLYASQLCLFYEDDCYQQNQEINGIDYQQNNQEHVLNLNTNQLQAPLFLIHKSKQVPTKTIIRISGDRPLVLYELYIYEKENLAPYCSHTEIILNAKAQLQHVQLLKGMGTHMQNLNTTIRQSSESIYQGSVFSFDMFVQNSTFSLNLNENKAKAYLYALLFPRKNQKNQLSFTAHHAHPHCDSEMCTRGVIQDSAKGDFLGKIVVDKDAHQSKAHLENKNLVLSLEAEMTTQPQLEVYHDDVQCSHGATVGHLDKEALFYLTSRGIPENQAKKMLIMSFIEPVFKQVPALMRPYLESCLNEY